MKSYIAFSTNIRSLVPISACAYNRGPNYSSAENFLPIISVKRVLNLHSLLSKSSSSPKVQSKSVGQGINFDFPLSQHEEQEEPSPKVFIWAANIGSVVQVCKSYIDLFHRNQAITVDKTFILVTIVPQKYSVSQVFYPRIFCPDDNCRHKYKFDEALEPIFTKEGVECDSSADKACIFIYYTLLLIIRPTRTVLFWGIVTYWS